MQGYALTDLDVAIVVGYISVVVAAGLALTRRKASASDYYLASNRVRWPVIGLSLVASNISPTALIGITGFAYSLGIAVYNYEWMATVVLVLFALLFLPAVLRSRVYTMPEFLERRYGPGVRIWFAVLTLFLNVVLDAAGALYGGALLIAQFSSVAGAPTVMIVMASLAGVYAMTGGLRAVMYSESIQGCVVLGSAFILAALAFHRVGGWDSLMSSVPPAHLSLIRPAGDPVLPWTGLAFGAPILGFYFWCTNQFMVQRMLAARTLEDGQWGALFAGGLKLLTLFAIVLPGIAAAVLFPALARGDEAYPRLVFALLPHGLIGVVLAAFGGALLAQLSATYNSASTLIAMDLVRRAHPGLDDRALVRAGRVATVCLVGASILWAPQIGRFPSLWQYLQAVMAYAAPPVVALFTIGMLWPAANNRGAWWCIGSGTAAGAILLMDFVLGRSHLHFLHAAAVIFAASALGLVVGSKIGPRCETHEPVPIDSVGAVTAMPMKLGAAALIALALSIVIWFR